MRSLLSNKHNLGAAALNFSGKVVLTSLVATSLIVGARWLGLLQGLELGAYDQLMRWRPDEGIDERLLVVGISEVDIQATNEYPVFDGTLAKLLQKIQEYQPRAVGLDILRDIPQGTGREALIKQLEQSENIIAVCKMSSAEDPGISSPPGVPDEGVGFADLPLDAGGTLRRSLLFSVPVSSKLPARKQHLCNTPDPENPLPSFDLQLALLYLQPENISAELTPTGQLKIGPTIFKRLEAHSGGYRNADVGNYQMMLNYRSANNGVRLVSLTEVMEGKIDPAWVQDRIVMIGYTAPIVKDDFYTPYSAGAKDNQKMPGVVVHAQNVSQILSSVLNKRPLIWYWSELNEVLWIWGWSLVGGTIAWCFRRPLRFSTAGIVALGLLSGFSYTLFLKAGWIPLVPPILSLLGTAIVVVLLDRGYAKAIYQGVKGFLKIDIQIDQEKKNREVTEISETDYFDHLQQQGKKLKNRENNGFSENGFEPNVATRRVRQTPSADESIQSFNGLDYFQQLERRMQLKKTQGNGEGTETMWESEFEDEQRLSSQSAEDDEEDYFQQLQKRARTLRHREEHAEK